MEINVCQVERPLARDNKSIGRFHLDGIPAAPRGVPQIEVTFDIDANGILNVSAKDKGTGKEQKIRIEASSGLTEQEIQRMRDEAKANEEKDKAEKERIDKINAADSTSSPPRSSSRSTARNFPPTRRPPSRRRSAS